MILPFISGPFERQAYLICLRRPLDEVTFLRRARTKSGTYAGDLMARLYEGIFHRSLELRQDYAKYYSVEYTSFAEYLSKRFLFPEDVTLKLIPQYSRSAGIFYFNSGYSFLEADYGLGFLEKLLEPRRRK